MKNRASALNIIRKSECVYNAHFVCLLGILGLYGKTLYLLFSNWKAIFICERNFSWTQTFQAYFDYEQYKHSRRHAHRKLIIFGHEILLPLFKIIQNIKSLYNKCFSYLNIRSLNGFWLSKNIYRSHTLSLSVSSTILSIIH